MEIQDQDTDLFLSIINKHLGEAFELGKDKVVIIIDKRENKAKYNRIKVIEFLQKNPECIVIEETLTTGDFLISSRCGIERKRGDDFKGSVIAGSNKTNIFDELYRLKQSVINPMLIIENYQMAFNQYTNWKVQNKITLRYQLKNARFSIESVYGIPVRETKNEQETAELIFDLAKYQQKKKEKLGIARSIPKSKNQSDRQKYFLEGFVKTGLTKADRYLKLFENPISFINALLNTDLTFTKTGNPKGIKPIDESKPSLIGIKGIGFKYVKENKELLEYIDKGDKSEQSKES